MEGKIAKQKKRLKKAYFVNFGAKYLGPQFFQYMEFGAESSIY